LASANSTSSARNSLSRTACPALEPRAEVLVVPPSFAPRRVTRPHTPRSISGAGSRAAHFERLEAERSDLGEHAEERRIVGQLAAEQRFAFTPRACSLGKASSKVSLRAPRTAISYRRGLVTHSFGSKSVVHRMSARRSIRMTEPRLRSFRSRSGNGPMSLTRTATRRRAATHRGRAGGFAASR
jgi:hypothetical protein